MVTRCAAILLCAALLARLLPAAEETPPAAEATPADPPVLRVSADAWQARAEAGVWTRVKLTVRMDGTPAAEVVRESRVESVTEDATGRHVTVAISAESGGNKDKIVQRYLVPAGTGADAPAPSTTPPPAAELTVAGRKLACTIQETEETAGSRKIKVRIWTAAEVPMGGTVRIEHDGAAAFELLDFGPRAKP